MKKQYSFLSIPPIALLVFISVTFSQPIRLDSYQFGSDTIKEKPVQYRRGIEVNENMEKYEGKNLEEEKTRLFPLQSSGVWTELNPKVPRVDYLGIQFINKDTGWAVGDLGALIKTTDGGNSWTVSETNTTTPILKVRSHNGQLVIASGFDGLILRSSDGGETFSQIISNVSGDLWGLELINDTLGFACGNGNSLTRTTDGGLSWQRIFTPGYTSDYWWIDFLTESYGFIAANGKVLRTTDGGNNWELIQAGDNQALFTIDVIDSLHIAAAGYGGTGYPAKNIYSSNGGYTWINGGFLTMESVNCIKYTSPDTGYLVMSNVGAQKTTNRGQTWTMIGEVLGVMWDNYELQLLNEDLIGYCAGTGLKINKAVGNFNIWNKIIINDNFADVFFTNENTGYAAGDAGVYKTLDGGTNWFKLQGFPINAYNVWYTVTFTDSLTGFIGGHFSRIYKTTDSGNYWFLTNSTGLIDSSGIIYKIFFIDNITGWAVTGSGGILKTTDRGNSWFAQYSAPSFPTFQSIYFLDSLYGWTANLGGRPFKTTNGGLNWTEQITLNIWESRDVFFIDYQKGFLIESNKLYKTIDGGISWVQNTSLTGFSISKFSTYRDSTIFIIGYKTYRSIDGGENWFEYTELNLIRVKGFYLLNSGLGYGVGERGLILKYFDSTFVPVELKSFYCETINNKIILHWVTETEINNKGFEIERRGPESKIWEYIGFVQGNGTSSEENSYSYTDFIDHPGKYSYRLKQVDYNGRIEYSNAVEVFAYLPSDFSLSQNYPNPFNNNTVIIYQIPDDGFVTLKIYDVLGNEVKTLVQKNNKAGIYKINFTANDLSSGIYFYELIEGAFHSIKKLILMK